MAIIDKPSDYFQTKLYTGDDTNNRQISLNFSPDWTWLKARSQAYSQIVYDRVRGVGNRLNTNGTTAESDGTDLSWTNSGCTTNSFTVDRGTNESQNETGTTFVAWNWLAGGTASSNTDGSITSSVSANQDAGFSIVSYTGTGSLATVGHGLNSVPSMIITKNITSSSWWGVYHASLGNTKQLYLNVTNAAATASEFWNNTSPTSSVFTVNTDGTSNENTRNYIAYCFAEKQGYSKFGSYTGNGSSDGSYIHLGFKPAMVITKRTDAAADWFIRDNKQDPENVMNEYLSPNTTATSGNLDSFDFISNGFKIRNSNNAWNGSGNTYIYMAFAENPLVSTAGVPACAR